MVVLLSGANCPESILMASEDSLKLHLIAHFSDLSLFSHIYPILFGNSLIYKLYQMFWIMNFGWLISQKAWEYNATFRNRIGEETALSETSEMRGVYWWAVYNCLTLKSTIWHRISGYGRILSDTKYLAMGGLERVKNFKIYHGTILPNHRQWNQ